METILRAIQIISLIASLVLTAIMVFTIRKPRLVSARGKLLSIGISLIMLFFYLLISGARLNSAVSLPVFILGFLIGALRGFTLRFDIDEEQVLVRGSWIFLLAWGGSWLITQMVAFLASSLLFSISLILVYLSTGTQVGLEGITLVRRSLVRFRPPGV